MGAKVTTVVLSAPSLGVARRFPFAQAERILSMPRSGWELTDDKYIWNGNGLERKRNKGAVRQAVKD